MKALFIGGTGLISSAVSALAVQKGIELYLLTRGKRDGLAPDGATVLHGDINDTTGMQKLLKDRHFDAVVDWVVFKPEEIERDIGLFTGRTGQYIFISTVATYQRPVSYYLVNESCPQRNAGWDYAEGKIACEERLRREYRENAFPMTIARPSHTYGPTTIPFAITSWDHPWTLADRVLKGKKIIVPGDGTSLWTLTHNSDFAKGLIGLLGNSQAVGHEFHITSDEVKTWEQYLGDIGRALGEKPVSIHIASDCIAAFLPEVRGGLLGDASNSYVVDNSKIKRFVPEYVATTRFENGIRQSIDYFRSHPERRSVDSELDAKMDGLIAVYEKFLQTAGAF